MSPKADLILLNARILPLEPGQPSATSVAIKNGRILAVGQLDEMAPLIGPETRRLDCQGMTLMPGFHDAHCHFRALASRFLDLDCSPNKANSIAEIKNLVSQKARTTAPGQWIRAFGYDEDSLDEGRHPNRHDLDKAAPVHPVRLEHRTGHATVLNSRAMLLLGLTRDSEDPPDGVILREEETGQPTGLFLEMSSQIRRMMTHYRREEEFVRGVKQADNLLLSKGITSIQDAGANNGPEQWETFRRLKETGKLTPRVTMMTGLGRGRELDLHNSQHPLSVADLRVGATKVVITLTTGSLQPTKEELIERAIDLHKKGHQIAFHAVEAEAVLAAAQAIMVAVRSHQRPDPRHRIEHCSEAPAEVIGAVKASGALVVTQPGFIHHNGAKYLSKVDASLIPHLYPLASLVEAGITWAASSDAPVVPVEPLLHVYSTVTRKTSEGLLLGACQAVTVKEALKAWTIGGVYSCFQENVLGSIRVRKYADLVLLDRDPTQVYLEEIRDLNVMMTIVGGKIVWEA